MAIDYASLLSTEQKRSILEQRLNQFALEAYQHDINRKVAVASNNDEGIKNADDALAILSQAITIHQEELASLPAVTE